MILRSLRGRLALVIGSVCASIGVAGWLLAYVPARAVYRGHLDRLLHVLASGALSTAEAAGPSDAVAARIARAVESPWKGGKLAFRVWSDRTGATIASSEAGPSEDLPPLLDPSPSHRPAAESQTFFDGMAGKKKAYRCVWARRGDLNVLVAHPSGYETRRLETAASSLAIAITAIVAAAVALCAWLSTLALAPLRDATRAIEQAAEGSLPPTPRTLAELRPLIDAVRSLLARATASTERLERLGADVAHELRTPLAIAKSTLQLTASTPRPPEEYVRAIEATVDDLRAMERLVEQLALLSKLDDASELHGRAPLRLDLLLRGVIEQFAGVDATAPIEVSELPSVEVEGHEELLARLFSNLLENATRYGPEGAPVRVELAVGSGDCSVSVEDRGGKISQEELERMFDRFYRGPLREGRGGTGLGLAIARRIVRRHGGDLTVQVVPGTLTRFVARLPRR